VVGDHDCARCRPAPHLGPVGRHPRHRPAFEEGGLREDVTGEQQPLPPNPPSRAASSVLPGDAEALRAVDEHPSENLCTSSRATCSVDAGGHPPADRAGREDLHDRQPATGQPDLERPVECESPRGATKRRRLDRRFTVHRPNEGDDGSIQIPSCVEAWRLGTVQRSSHPDPLAAAAQAGNLGCQRRDERDDGDQEPVGDIKRRRAEGIGEGRDIRDDHLDRDRH
jgi:hypothetical protein